MKERRRKSLAAVGSAVVHVVPVVWGMVSLTPHIEVDLDLELTEVELIEPDVVQGHEPPAPQAQQVAPAPTPPPPATPPATPEPKPAPKPEPKAEPPADQHDLGKARSKVDQLGPTNSTFFLMLVPKRIRKLSFADKALDIMAPLPDFQYLIAGGGFDAMRDFDHLVIASPDIRDWRQTFLAVDYKMSRAEVQRAIERAAAANGESIEWLEENGIIRGNPRPTDTSEPDVDTRWFVLLDDNVALYLREEFLPHVLAPDPGQERTSGNFVANLAKLRKFAASQPTAGLQIVFKDLSRALKRAKVPFQMPDTIELTAEASEDPELFVRFEFATLVDAKAFEKWWKHDLEEIFDSKFELKLFKGSFYEPLELSRNDAEVQLWSRFETKQAALILGMLADNTARFLKKTPEQMAELRQQRKENWLKRKGGKLPPSVLDPAATPTGDPPAPPAASGGASEPAPGQH